MRAFVDQYQNLFDLQGRPLIGRLTFYEPDTTTLKSIYGSDGEVLSNPIYCNGILSSQVFLEGDYKVTFEKYVGNGNFKVDDASESWLLFKTEQNISGDLTVTLEDSFLPSYDTIEDLKSISVDNLADGYSVLVLGYYSSGDSGASRVYQYYSNSTLSVDDGVVISPITGIGRWIMVIPYNYIDVRWYGDIPNSSVSDTTCYLSRRSLASTASNTWKKNLYFPSSGTSIGYYVFDGSNTVSTAYDIITDEVRFVIKPNTTGTLITCKNLQKVTPYLFTIADSTSTGYSYSLYADWINTSWFYSNVSNVSGARKGYIVDNENSVLTYSDTQLKIRTTLRSGDSLSNVNIIEGFSFIDERNIYLSDMTIEKSWFVNPSTFDYETYLHMNNSCVILLENIKDPNIYIRLKNMLSDSNYGDINEQSISGVSLLDGAILENANGSFSADGDLELHNFSGIVYLSNPASKLNLIDTRISLSGSNFIESIESRRGSITSNSNTINKVYLENVSLSGEITATSAIDVRDSKLNGDIYIYPNQSAYNESFINNECNNTIYELDPNATSATIAYCTRNATYLNNNNLRYDDSESYTNSWNMKWDNFDDRYDVQGILTPYQAQTAELPDFEYSTNKGGLLVNLADVDYYYGVYNITRNWEKPFQYPITGCRYDINCKLKCLFGGTPDRGIANCVRGIYTVDDTNTSIYVDGVTTSIDIISSRAKQDSNMWSLVINGKGNSADMAYANYEAKMKINL